MKRSRPRVFAVVAIVAAGFAYVTWLFSMGLTDKNATERDFIQYWAAEQQITHGANPYDVQAILHLERSAGLEGHSPKVTFSPPVAFFLWMPLGWMGAKAGLILWLYLLFACLGASVWILMRLYGRPDSGLHWVGFAFPPVLACLMAGQLGIFFLFAITLFLCLHKTRPLLAGAALFLCALKPQLFVPCFIALALWSAHRKCFRVLAGFLATLGVNCALTLSLDPHIWSQYAQMMRSTRTLQVFIPALSVALRFLVDRNAVWIQFLPEAAACCWAAWYYWTRRQRWDWGDQGLLLLLVSELCSPYAWFFDEAMLFPAVLSALYKAERSGRSLIPFAVAGGIALFEVMAHVELQTAYYLWTSPAWLAFYLYAARSPSATVEASATAVPG